MAFGKVAILDAGAQYGKVIDRRIRELNIESEILPLNIPSKKLKQFSALIISGGPQSVYGENAPKFDPKIFTLGKPLLGICYGLQLMMYVLGGRVAKLGRREDGPCNILVDPKSKLFWHFKRNQDVLMSHGDSVILLAPDFKTIAKSDGTVAAVENSNLKMYGVQFHPEVDLTVNGSSILKNFLYKVAEIKPSFTVSNREKQAILLIRKSIGKSHVIVFVSGGVDSAVCSALIAKALPQNRIHSIHIDTGLMRKNESQNVKKALEKIGVKLEVIDASGDFLHKLRETVDPEEKRKIIGDKFIEIQTKILKSLGLNLKTTFLAQGTLRPDLIESASSLVSSNATTIKTHHNDSPRVRKLRKLGRILEPLSEYHKDEVRRLGKLLGLPSEVVERQPFPGPGLGVRIICAKKPYLKDYKRVFNQIRSYYDRDINVSLLPIRTVGVQGDERTYKYVVGLSGKKNWKRLFELSREIPKEIHGVNRVVYIFGKKVEGPLKGITPTFIDQNTISQLQQADDIVNKILQKNKLTTKLAQMPVILMPVNFGKTGSRSIALRPFKTLDFMTGLPAIPGIDISEEVIEEMVEQILIEVPGISYVVYDLTSKPPATTEWE